MPEMQQEPGMQAQSGMQQLESQYGGPQYGMQPLQPQPAMPQLQPQPAMTMPQPQALRGLLAISWAYNYAGPLWWLQRKVLRCFWSAASFNVKHGQSP